MNGATTSTTASGGNARHIPLTSAPTPRCAVHQAEPRARADQDRAGPSASPSPGTPHRARTAATDMGRTNPNAPVAAARGRAAP